MTSLTSEEIKKEFPVQLSEISDYLRKKHLPLNKVTKLKATKAIRASKIKKELGKDFSIANTIADWQVIYGRMRVGGALTFLHTTNKNQDLHLIITVACHEIHSVEKVWFDDEEIVFSSKPGWSTQSIRADGSVNTAFANKVYIDVNYGSQGQSALSSAISNTGGKWTADHKQSGRAHVYLRMKWDATLFPNSIPEISFEIKGKKCYNPNTGVTEWTDNAAICLSDFLMNSEFGRGISQSNLTSTEWQAAVTKSAESVSLSSGGTESRYTANTVFTTNESYQEIIEQFLSAMAGTLVSSAGKWKIYAGSYREPTLTITESDILTSIQSRTRVGKSDNFNAVKGTFVDPSKNYEESDFPPVKNAYYQSQDSGELIYEDVQFPMTTSAPTAQRLAKIGLERQRQPIELQFKAALRMVQLEPGDTVNVTYERLGFSTKVFEVIDADIEIDQSESGGPSIGIPLYLRETASGVWDWNAGLETRIDLAPNTDLPNAFVVENISGLELSSGTDELYLRADGTVFTRIKVAWDTLDDAFVTSGGLIEIQYRKTGSSTWLSAPSVPGEINETYILDVQDGSNYDVRVRAKNAIGATSPNWSTITSYTVLGKSAPPSDVTGFRAEVGGFGLFLYWNSIPDLDLAYYEIRQGDEDDTWDDSQVIAEVRGTSFQLDLKTAGGYKFQIKAVDTSGNYSTTPKSLDVSIARPTAVEISSGIEGQNYVLEWTESTGMFSIGEYEIYYGSVFASATLIGKAKSTTFRAKVDWGNQRRFWVVARDVAGNLGVEAYVDIEITPPSSVDSFISEVVDNFVLLKWTPPSIGSLPIAHYKVYKGTNFSEAELTGEHSGTFPSFFEIVAGTYTYWVQPVDTAGNLGTELPVTAVVSEPPDFIINDDDTFDPNVGVGINTTYDGLKAIMPSYTDHSWDYHFSSNGWSTIQNQIDAGYPFYIQPVPDHAYWEKTIDYGAVLPPTLVKWSYSKNDVVGNPVATSRIALSNDGISWSWFTGGQAYATNTRYIKVRVEIGTLPGVSGTPIGLLLGLTYP